MNHRRTLLARPLLVLLLGLVGAESRGGEPAAPGRGNADLFAPDRVLDVRIELAPEDWEILRREGRSLSSIWSGRWEDLEYTNVRATVTVDGARVENAGVRKKGFLGSLSAIRPSLKIDFAEYVPGQDLQGLRWLTLNNDKQDPSHTHQVMAYALFRKAGYPAPRCNFARVTVNGADLGVYSNVECVKEPFLARQFGDGSGCLFEGQGADFTPGLLSKFQRKAGPAGPPGKSGDDRSALDAVVRALQAGEAGLLEALGAVIDLDAFLTFWALEVVTGHWDGYTGNRNNFYLYRHPGTGLFHFIPWGADGTFRKGHAFLPDIPDSVYAWSQISHRLYGHPEGRRRYHERLKSLLETAWNEEALLAETARIERIASPDREALEAQRAFIRGRRKDIEGEIEGAGPAWTHPPVVKPPTSAEPIPVSGRFSTTWAAKETFLPSKGAALELTLGGEKQAFTVLLQTAGKMTEGDRILNGTASVKFYGLRAGGKNLFVGLNTVPALFRPGVLPFHGLETCGVVVEHDVKAGSFKVIGLIGGGAITFDAAGAEPGDKVEGRFEGLLALNPK